MKILLLTSRLPFPPDRGDRLRTFHFLRVLAARHDVHLLSFIESDEERRHQKTLCDLGARVDVVHRPPLRSRTRMLLALPSRVPFQVAYYSDRRMRRLVAAACRDRDLVIAHLIRMAPYLEGVAGRARRVVDFCDCISSEYRASLPYRSGWQRLFYAEEARRVALFERQWIETIDEGWVISDAEVEKFPGGPGALRVVRNGVSAGEGEARPADPERPCLLFTGNMSVPHNVDAATVLVKEILPRVLPELPGARIVIAGADPDRSVCELAGSRVEVTGRVANLGDVLRSADVFVAPMRYVAGVQNKALEAMSVGLPVVTSELVARGIGALDGEHLLVGERPEQIAQHVIRLLRDPELARRIAGAGKKHVLGRFRWEAVLTRVEDIEREGRP